MAIFELTRNFNLKQCSSQHMHIAKQKLHATKFQKHAYILKCRHRADHRLFKAFGTPSKYRITCTPSCVWAWAMFGIKIIGKHERGAGGVSLEVPSTSAGDLPRRARVTSPWAWKRPHRQGIGWPACSNYWSLHQWNNGRFEKLTFFVFSVFPAPDSPVQRMDWSSRSEGKYVMLHILKI